MATKGTEVKSNPSNLLSFSGPAASERMLSLQMPNQYLLWEGKQPKRATKQQNHFLHLMIRQLPHSLPARLLQHPIPGGGKGRGGCQSHLPRGRGGGDPSQAHPARPPSVPGKFPNSCRRGIKAPADNGATQTATAAPAMSPHLRLLLCLLLLLAAAPCRGAPLAGELRCRCVRTVSEVIPPRRLARVEFVAEGPHCAVPEVIATTKQGQTVCLSPSAPWVKLIVTRILNSSAQKN
ncbi:uncharacterized protein LOC122153790 [Tyto alba]|uniref:uncharacterized protein LOC122153790 n=1 Tax=Tyto alba TaxID=56313 RepID=UPI001C667E7F|nr:uncharacterized protein LOC122153790 [Tyto alba]